MSSSSDDVWTQKLMKFLGDSLGMDKEGKMNFQRVHEYMDRFAGEETFDPVQVKMFRDTTIAFMKRVGLNESHDIAIQEYIANLKALVPKDEVLKGQFIGCMTALFRCLDSNNDGYITYDEWIVYMEINNFGSSDEVVKQAFDEIDANKDGKLSLQEFIDVNSEYWLKAPTSPAIKKMFGPD